MPPRDPHNTISVVVIEAPSRIKVADVLDEHFRVERSVFAEEIAEGCGFVQVATIVLQQRRLLLTWTPTFAHWHLQEPEVAAPVSQSVQDCKALASFVRYDL